jgi:hypothetical protein
MLGTFLDKLSGFFDQRFLVAYWGPTLIGLGLAAGLGSVLFSFAGVLAWWTKRNLPPACHCWPSLSTTTHTSHSRKKWLLSLRIRPRSPSSRLQLRIALVTRMRRLQRGVEGATML